MLRFLLTIRKQYVSSWQIMHNMFPIKLQKICFFRLEYYTKFCFIPKLQRIFYLHWLKGNVLIEANMKQYVFYQNCKRSFHMEYHKGYVSFLGKYIAICFLSNYKKYFLTCQTLNNIFPIESQKYVSFFGK